MGPIVNPANGHTYYRLSPSNWTEAEGEAVGLGGHLATINDANEDSYIFNTFSQQGQYGLWIGINDAAAFGQYAWSSGEPVAYTNWAFRQPDHFVHRTGEVEHYGMIFVEQGGDPSANTGRWNDFANVALEHITAGGTGGVLQGVVELDYVRPDLVATSLTWDPEQGGVDFGYEVKDAALTQDTTAALYWASGETFDTAIDADPSTPDVIDPAYDTTIERPIGQYTPPTVPRSALGTPPAGATHLLLAVDPPTTPNGLIQESDESNNVLSIAIPTTDIKVHSATTKDSKSAEFEYEVTGIDPPNSFQVGVYRSADEQFDSATDVRIGDYYTVNADPSPGWHPATVSDRSLVIDPKHPYVFVVADPLNTITESDDDPITEDNSAHFRKWTLGLVTHGFQLGLGPFGADPIPWLTRMVAALKAPAVGYDTAYYFPWVSESRRWAAGQTQAAGQRLAIAVQDAADAIPVESGDDVVDLHLIGHSRGAVVIDQALQELERDGLPRRLAGGYIKMTMLDPHPARNKPGAGDQHSFGPGASRLARFHRNFNDVARDPEIEVPSIVRESRVYFQRTTWNRATNLADRLLNLWGETVPGSRDPINLTNRHFTDAAGRRHTISHSTITDWYEARLRRGRT